MAYITDVFGGSNEYGFIAPKQGRIFAFSPYYVEITVTTLDVGTPVTMTCNGFEQKRYTNANKKVKFDISEMLQSFFRGVELGQVEDAGVGTYANTASKLIQVDKEIEFMVAEDTNTLTLIYDIIYGALQIGETEATEETIYYFDGLPLTVTQNIGIFAQDNTSDIIVENYFGKDIDILKAIQNETDTITKIDFYTPPSDIIKTVNIERLNVCSNYIYLRWIYKGQYKYFLFQDGNLIDELEDGSTMGNNIWSLEPTNDEFKSDIRLKNKSGNETIECGLKSATYKQQLHIIGLQRSIHRWMYQDGNWIEVNVEMSPVIIDRFHSNQEINIKVIKPSLYIESL